MGIVQDHRLGGRGRVGKVFHSRARARLRGQAAGESRLHMRPRARRLEPAKILRLSRVPFLPITCLFVNLDNIDL